MVLRIEQRGQVTCAHQASSVLPRPPEWGCSHLVSFLGTRSDQGPRERTGLIYDQACPAFTVMTEMKLGDGGGGRMVALGVWTGSQMLLYPPGSHYAGRKEEREGLG